MPEDKCGMFSGIRLPATVGQEPDIRTNFKQPFLIPSTQMKPAGPGIGDNRLRMPACEESVRLKRPGRKNSCDPRQKLPRRLLGYRDWFWTSEFAGNFHDAGAEGPSG